MEIKKSTTDILITAIDVAIRARIDTAVSEEREACAKIAQRPYGDEVEAFGGDEPMAVGNKIAAAIRARGGAQ